MSESSDEYALLRNEINLNLQIMDNSRNVLYVSISAILAFGLSQNESFIFILPYIVIIPIYLVTIENLYGAYKLGTYLMTFHEGEKYRWETRLFKLFDEQEDDRKKPKSKKLKGRFDWVFHMPYLISSMACTSLSIYFTIRDRCSMSLLEFSIKISISMALFVIVLLISIKHNDVSKFKREFKKNWDNLKLSELNESKNSDEPNP